MLFTAALSLFLGLGSSPVAACPFSSGFNTTAPRGYGTTTSKELVTQAEATSPRIRFWPTPKSGPGPSSLLLSPYTRLNVNYFPCGINFYLAGTDRTQNVDWFNKAGPGKYSYQTAMKNQLRKGAANALNVYGVGLFFDSIVGLLGYITFPFSYPSAPKDDVVVTLYSSVPGGTASPYNEGRTLAHGATHRAGSYHTFKGRYNSSGDYIDDTPTEAGPIYGCPASSDTRAGGGSNPDDSYRNNFTP